jgi:PAS domain S-box-containing protein
MPSPDPRVPDSPPAASETSHLLRGEVAFRLLVDAVQDYAIFLLGPDGRVLTWNRGAQRIKGYTADEIIGEHFSRFYIPEEREEGRPMRLLGWAAEQGRFEDEGWRVRKDGTRFWADVIVTALVDEQGQPYAYAKVTRDLTERRAAEERERRLLAEQEARAAAEAALRVRERFLSIASHELKTPVATVQLGVETLLRAHGRGRLDDGRLVTGLRRVRAATDRLGVLVGELLDISRLTADQLPFQAADVDLVPLVTEVLDRFADAVPGADTIRLVAPDRAVVTADASRIDQVVTNLVDNALKFTDGAPDVEVRIEPDADGVGLVVADRGRGLASMPESRMFEAFGRGDDTSQVPGLGLGLHIARTIVERHGGRISARSQPEGAGAVFAVWLPREAQTS